MRLIIDTLQGRSRDLGDFTVRRVLPIAHRKTVGPYRVHFAAGAITRAR